MSPGPVDGAAVRRPTLTEVAALAGVSLKTAARAPNSEPNVAADTGRRVRDAADLLGYRLNGIARELRRGATSTLVGLISGDLANPFSSAVASGVERELRPYGLQLLTAGNDEDAGLERALVDAFLQRRVPALTGSSPRWGRPATPSGSRICGPTCTTPGTRSAPYGNC